MLLILLALTSYGITSLWLLCWSIKIKTWISLWIWRTPRVRSDVSWLKWCYSDVSYHLGPIYFISRYPFVVTDLFTARKVTECFLFPLCMCMFYIITLVIHFYAISVLPRPEFWRTFVNSWRTGTQIVFEFQFVLLCLSLIN